MNLILLIIQPVLIVVTTVVYVNLFPRNDMVFSLFTGFLPILLSVLNYFKLKKSMNISFPKILVLVTSIFSFIVICLNFTFDYDLHYEILSLVFSVILYLLILGAHTFLNKEVLNKN